MAEFMKAIQDGAEEIRTLWSADNGLTWHEPALV